METETKICQNCKQDFAIATEDFSFYEKMKVPPPTFCPECRLKQRLIWRNEKALYRRECDLCKKQIISIYSPDKLYTVYCRECFHSDEWDPLSFGISIDLTHPFLEQFRELQLRVPRISSFVFQNTSSEYVNGAAYNKNCYMIFRSDSNEDLLFSYSTSNSRSSSDLLNCNECDMCYDSTGCSKCYQVISSEDCSTSQNLILCKNCINCQDCVGCVNLHNVRYAIFNEVYTKEEYLKKLKELGVESRSNLSQIKEQLKDFQIQFPVKYLHGLHNVNVSGDYVSNSKNALVAFDSDEIEDSKFLNHGNQAKDSYDSYVLVDKSERAYNVVSGIALNNVLSGNCIWHGYDISYSDTCENSHNLFGCVGLKKKEYCILNIQLTKEEYEKIVPKIIQNMKDMPLKDRGMHYTYGDLFPESFSPFAYNETVAQEYFPEDKARIEKIGLTWKKEEDKKYDSTIEAESTSDQIKGVEDSITKEIIACAHKNNCNHQCTNAFRITQDELNLYRRLNVPLPLLCFNCRNGERIARRNPCKLWHRSCMCDKPNHDHTNKCPNEFETSYAPDRPEIVYCEKCYQKEVL